MNQNIISGLGNIYADEVCYACGIHPTREGRTISEKECDRIIEHSIRILNKSIDEGGSTVKSYHSGNGVDGLFQQSLLVYGKKGEHCSRCGSIIEKIRLKGRGTCYCPQCQK
jgi:formamidopyrimidine-DNA glycosylase